MVQQTADRFRAAVEKGDIGAIEELFASDVRFYSPVKFTPFEGRPMVMGLFGVLLRTFEDFRYIGRFEGAAESSAPAAAGDGGGAMDASVLLFRTTVRGKEIHGIDLLHFDEDGLIKEFTVMVRPQSAVAALGAAVYEGLVADGLVPGPDAAPQS
ncbi:nuclear transport factor 2 family protein [Streptomyces ochraceiscleroticus]|uniref:Nuclear transport factor 2 family protein n=1 Tax=Streptomyces ochraceiscleroticus TaxID=47761 RepID=A0ABW1MK05_9ACTN|nr:nuclear transport factor 2 family protein [Streptomyces ochraceiscleroticus]